MAFGLVMTLTACVSDDTAVPRLVGSIVELPPSTTTTAVPTTLAVTTTAATTTSLPTIDHAAQFLNIIRPANRAASVFNEAAAGLPADASPQDLAVIASPLADAVALAAKELTSAAWPSELQPLISALVGAAAKVEADLRSVNDQTEATFAAWDQTFATDLEAMAAASAKVRDALGLPPSG